MSRRRLGHLFSSDSACSKGFGTVLPRDPPLWLESSSAKNIKDSISAAGYILEAERRVDGQLQSRYFIESLDKVVSTEEAPSAAVSPPVSTVKRVTSEQKEDVYLEVRPKEVFGTTSPTEWKGTNELEVSSSSASPGGDRTPHAVSATAPAHGEPKARFPSPCRRRVVLTPGARLVSWSPWLEGGFVDDWGT
ncbi:hypothetical protein B2J93_6845 [Marssonina coronariae]|uniref:Uncharacterized protein n=1 Tax=Diplocarpon coronariae TaxID=2795749 RepID=A0A218YVG7_9HELO|nr:hypothetical protein B2J93_6845 [Marssonina coronariae]